jgi:hypothetical protein
VGVSPNENNQLFEPHSIEAVTVALIATISAVTTWYYTDLTGVQALTNAGIALLVTAVAATGLFYLVKRLDPSWYPT